MKLVSLETADAKMNKQFADEIRKIADRFEAGEIANIVIVGDDRADQKFTAAADYSDLWRMIGALEYAKACVLRDSV